MKILPLFERLKSSLEEAIQHEKGELKLRVTEIAVPDPPEPYTAENIQQIRERLKMSQAVFASLLYVSSKTVQSWEQGVRVPSHAAARLLQFIEHPGLLSESVRPKSG